MNKPLRCFNGHVLLVDSCSLHFDYPSGMKPTPPRGSLHPPFVICLLIPVLSCLFSPQPGVYTAYLYIVVVPLPHFCSIHVGCLKSAPNAFHEHTTTAHAVYLCCILHLFSGFSVQSQSSSHRHRFLTHAPTFSRKLILVFFFGPGHTFLRFVVSFLSNHVPVPFSVQTQTFVSWSASFILYIVLSLY